MANFKFLDINGVSTLLDQLKNKFVRKADVESSLNDTSELPVQNKVVKTALDNKVDKVVGKQLSTEDFTTELKTKLDGIEAGATNITVDSEMSNASTNPVQNKIVKAAIDAVSTKVDNIIEDAPEAYDTLKEISDYISTHETEYEALLAISNNKVDKVEGKGLSTNDFTDELLNKLNGIDDGATDIIVDDTLSSTSENPVQNKVINEALEGKVSTSDVVSVISATDGSKIPTSQAIIDYVEENGGGVASKDIAVTLLSTGWAVGENSTLNTQTVNVIEMREGVTPLIFLKGDATDEEIYAYNLIVNYQAGNGTITFYAAEKPEVDITIVLKGVPVQQTALADNTVLVPVTASSFTLSETTQRYEQTITVEGMTIGLGGTWDILRSGEVLSEEESKIAASITDVIRQTNAVKIVCTEMPEQDYTIVLSGTFKDAIEGDVLLSDVGSWGNRISALEENVNNLMASNSITEHQVVTSLPDDAASNPTTVYWVVES